MKSLNLLLVYCMLLFLIISCTNDDMSSNGSNSEVFVSSMIRKNYNPTSNELLSTINYSIANNKIVNATSTNSQNSQQTSSIYSYLQNVLTEITNSTNGLLSSKQYFIYNSNNKLIEYRTESFNNSGEIQSINKHVFNQVQDTIYSEWTRKNIGDTNFSLISNSKIVLDNTKNRVFFEQFDNVNYEFSRVTNEYDSNNNILNEKHFIMNPNGAYVNTYTNTATYNTSVNTLAYIYNKTFGKEVSMLLYHLQSNSINEINFKSYSSNTMNSYNTTFGNDGQTTFNISNNLNSNNFCINNTYSTYYSNTELTRFTYTYYFN